MLKVMTNPSILLKVCEEWGVLRPPREPSQLIRSTQGTTVLTSVIIDGQETRI